jgi:hypothetical protein
VGRYRRQTLLDDYAELRESGSTSDFPNILGNVMYRRLIDWAQSVPQVWRQYVSITEAPDLRPQTAMVGYESEDLLAIGEEGQYQDSVLGDAAFTWQIGTFGRAFSINRNVILNDDMGYIRQQPRRFGRAATRTLSQWVARSLVEANGLAFDAVALFDTNTHNNNVVSGTLGLFNSTNIQTAITTMRNQTVLNNYYSATPKFLLLPPNLEFSARQIINSALIVAVGTTGTVTQIGNANVLQNYLDIVVDPFLTKTDAWYVFADPNDVPAFLVGFLNGKDTPDLLIEKPVTTNVAGGDDPYEFDFDVMRYKVRYEWGGAPGLWWGASRVAAS